MRLRFNIKLLDDSNNDLGGIRFTSDVFTRPNSESAFNDFIAKMIGSGMRKRLDLLEGIASGEIAVTGVPDIVIPP